jgi:hypothetical protein
MVEPERVGCFASFGAWERGGRFVTSPIANRYSGRSSFSWRRLGLAFFSLRSLVLHISFPLAHLLRRYAEDLSRFQPNARLLTSATAVAAAGNAHLLSQVD